jgi:hypothetical protein
MLRVVYCNGLQFGESQTIRRDMPSPYSGWNSKPSEKPAETDGKRRNSNETFILLQARPSLKGILGEPMGGVDTVYRGLREVHWMSDSCLERDRGSDVRRVTMAGKGLRKSH